MKCVLFRARHSHPEINGLPEIFHDGMDPMGFDQLSYFATLFFTGPSGGRSKQIDLYVTGLTPATCAVIDVCIRLGKRLTLWHYDKKRDTYKPQHIATTCGTTDRLEEIQ